MLRKTDIFLFIFCAGFIFACQSEGQKSQRTEIKLKKGECPEGHTDEVIEVIYGMPSEDLFNKADSGLVVLGGCEVSDDSPNYYCKKHQKYF